MSDQFDLSSILSQAMQMQEQFAEAQADAANAVVTGSAGGGVVQITITGSIQILDVTISPEAVDPADLGMLEDLVKAALIDAITQVDQLQQASMGSIDLGALGGFAGFGGDADIVDTIAIDEGPERP
jgi:DNA-binding YbaB/EbfC family protein